MKTYRSIALGPEAIESAANRVGARTFEAWLQLNQAAAIKQREVPPPSSK